MLLLTLLSLEDDQRRQLLVDAAQAFGGKSALGRRLGYADGAFVGQMIRGERPVTEKTLRTLAEVRELRSLINQSQRPAAETSASTPSSAARQEVSLEAALPVVLARLPGLDDYTAEKVLGAMRAAMRSQAPLDVIERDLVQWLNGPDVAATPETSEGKQRQANA